MATGAFYRFEAVGTATWEGSTLAVTIAPHGTDTWVFDDEIGEPASSAYDVAESMLAWGNDAARPWFGSESLSVTYVDDAPQLGIRLGSTASTTWNPSASLQTLLVWPGLTVSSNITSTAGVFGSVQAPFGLNTWRRYDMTRGGAAGAGSWTMETVPTSSVRPRLSCTLTANQAIALTEARRVASAPVDAWVWETGTSTWRLLSVGRTRVRRKTKIYTATFEVLG